MNIFWHELKAYRKSTIIWTCALTALAALYIFIFPVVANEAEAFKKILEGYSEEVRRALGISIDNIATLLGYYSFVFVYITLFGAIQAMNIGTSIMSKEVREKTADFLLTKPISRNKIMTSKLLAAFTSIVITNVIYLTVASILASAVSTRPYSIKVFIMISVTLFFTQLIFMSMGVIISVLITRIKSVLPISLGVVFGFFFINIFGSVIGDKAIRYITPFKYFDAAYIIKNGSYEISFIIVGIVFIIASIAASYIIYSKKDIPTV